MREGEGRSSPPGGLGPLLLAGLLASPLLAEEAPAKAKEKPVVSVSLTLVQVDAVVTDGKGRHVGDLGCDDFEIYEDRRKQPIANCSFVPTQHSSTLAPVDAPPPQAAIAPTPIRREDVRRTIVLVVDDLDLDLQSITAARAALETFLREQMSPGDLVSLIRTSGGAGALQQFTTDRRVLRAAIERIRFNPLASPDVFEPAGSLPVLNRPVRGVGGREFEQLRTDTLAGGTAGALRFVLMGLRDMPGRKSVVLFSKGLPLRAGDRSLTAFGRTVPALVDLANRASAVIYTIDTVGVVTGQRTAADSSNLFDDQSSRPLPGAGAAPVDLNTAGRAGGLRDLNRVDGLAALSDPTGGLLLRGSSDLSGQLGKIMDDQGGYYLIGYVPDASAFSANGRPTFHSLQVKVRRKGIKVRSRTGFYGMTDDDPRVTGKADVTSLAAALLSPFRSSDVGLSLSSLFYQDRTRGALLHSFLRIDSNGLTLVESPDGTLSSRVEVLAFTFNADGQVVDQLNRAGELRVPPQARESTSRYGINYTLDVPVKTAGAYQLRVAFRDAASGRVGSAYQFVEVPDLGNERLALSGIVMTNAVSGDEAAVSEISPPQSADASAIATAARRAFAAGQPIAYGLTVYNARVAESGQPSLQVQMRLLLDGKEVVTGQPRAVETHGQENPKALFVGGTLVLPRQMAPGEYQLLVTVVDTLAPPDRHRAVQASAFEVEAPG